MEQKRVAFKVAKAIKEAGYPQECGLWFSSDWREFSYTEDYSNCYAHPTYLDVWLWLWREKGIEILPTGGIIVQGKGKIEINNFYNYLNDPEEVIIIALDYLVENNLIK